jgi:type I restriction enzyme S subunit
MANNRQTYQLGAVCSRLSSGKNLRAEFIHDCGTYPVYGGNGLRGFTDQPNFEGECAIIGRQGAFCGNVRYFIGTAYMTEHAVVVCANEKSDTKYLSYLLSTMNLGRLSGQSAQPGLSVKTLSQQVIELPSLPEQIEIGRTLRALNDKIANNSKINHHLAQMAQAIFKSWFVENVTDDWNYVELGSVTTEIRTKVKEQLLPVLSAVKTGNLVLSEDYFTKQVYSKDIGKYIVVKPNEFAYNPARVNIGSVGINDFDSAGCVSPVYVVFRAEPEYHHFLRFFLKSPNFQEEVRVRASGSVRQSLSYGDFALIQVLYPSIDVVRKFNFQYEGILTSLRELEQENARLAELRDSLLPRLMSGELSVADLEDAK